MSKPLLMNVVSLGCAKNWVDTEVMAGSALTNHILLTEDPEQATITMINTCSFIRDARSESSEEIARAIDWKEQNKDRFLVVAGCMPQRDPEKIKEEFPQVDLFVGLDDVPRFGELISEMVKGKGHDLAPSESKYLYDDKTPRLQLTPTHFAYLKIAEGCNHNCAFCAIPAIRGRQRSRTIESIVSEARNLLDQGCSELILIAQDTTAYGKDLKNGSNISSLVRELDKLEGDFWIRILYTHPAYFNDEIVDMFAESKKLLPYVDIPLQHISDNILSAMLRGTPSTKVRELVSKLKERIPGLVLRSTFIVGFPGETVENYNELKEFIADTGFDRLGVFTYSPEEGTSAMNLDAPQVNEEIAEQRRDELMELQADIAMAKNQALVGQEVDIIVDEVVQDDIAGGRTAGDAPNVDQMVYFHIPDNWTELPVFARLKITQAHEYDLIGEII